jgi:PAS domain S-box-containing protein
MLSMGQSANDLEGNNRLLTALLDQSDECIKLLDQDGRILFVNRGGAIAMELASPADLIGQFWATRWPDGVRAEVEAALASARRGEVARLRAARPGSDQSVRWWDVTVTPVRADEGSAPRFLTIARDITAEIAERQRVAAISLEMRHRLKNALTVASGLLTLSARSRPELRTFVEEVVARFDRLSEVQDLILGPSSAKAFSEIVPLLASAYGDASALEFGALPEVRLSEAGMQALALAFGELATNSLKYGALKHGRRIRIDGKAGDGMLHLTWREGTSFGKPRAGGQGLELIDRLVRASGGSFTFEHDESVFLARISLPTVD